jgi:hypothetical protein
VDGSCRDRIESYRPAARYLDSSAKEGGVSPPLVRIPAGLRQAAPVDERKPSRLRTVYGMEAEYHRPFADASDVLTLLGEGA